MRPARGSKVAIDTSALIPAFDRDSTSHEASRKLIDAIRAGSLRAAVSTVAAAEAIVGPLKRKRHESVLAIQAVLLTVPNVELVPVDWRVAMLGARLRSTHGIRLPDALIIASATACDVFVTDDRRALTVAAAEGIETHSLVTG